MILGNIDQASFNPYRKLGHFSIQNNFQPSTWYLAYLPDTTSASQISKASFPTGTQPPYSWLLAPKGGELSSTTQIGGMGSLTSGMASGKALTSALDGSGTISSASMALVTSMIAALSGSGVLTAAMVGTTQMAASLAGSGNLAGAMNVLAGLVANLSSTGSLTAELRGDLYMAADIYVNSGTAEVNQIVAAVWSALAAEYNESGTMGEKLNGAGSAGDPWTTDLTGYNTTDTAGKIMKQIKKAAKDAASLSA
jgi:hypothetical protein